MVQSAFSDTLRDFVLLNIDSEDKLVVVILSTYSISKSKILVIDDIDWFYPYEKLSADGKHKNQTHKEKKIIIDGKTMFDKPLTNIYDADVSNDGSVSFVVFSNSSGSIHLIQRELGLISFKWSSNFWIYIIIFIHLAALLLGLLHFTLILHNTSRSKFVGASSS